MCFRPTSLTTEKKCSECGMPNPSSFRFCSQCGTRLPDGDVMTSVPDPVKAKRAGGSAPSSARVPKPAGA